MARRPYSIPEAARLLRCRKSDVYARIKAGTFTDADGRPFPVHQYGTSSAMRIPANALDFAVEHGRLAVDDAELAAWVALRDRAETRAKELLDA